MKVRPLASISHPDFNDVVVHFAGRPGPSNCTPDVNLMTPRERLLRIVLEQRLRAFSMFGVGAKAVCFTESTREGAQWLLKQGRYPPYGIAFPKRAVFERSGGPALYVRGDEWQAVADWPEELRARATRLWPGAEPTDEPFLAHHLASRSEWVIEREWRALPDGAGDWRFELADVAFLVVGDDAFLVDAAKAAEPNAADLLAVIPHLIMNTSGEVIRNEGVHLIQRQ